MMLWQENDGARYYVLSLALLLCTESGVATRTDPRLAPLPSLSSIPPLPTPIATSSAMLLYTQHLGMSPGYDKTHSPTPLTLTLTLIRRSPMGPRSIAGLDRGLNLAFTLSLTLTLALTLTRQNTEP